MIKGDIVVKIGNIIRKDSNAYFSYGLFVTDNIYLEWFLKVL